jgi:hypothetical protein
MPLHKLIYMFNELQSVIFSHGCCGSQCNSLACVISAIVIGAVLGTRLRSAWNVKDVTAKYSSNPAKFKD